MESTYPNIYVYYSTTTIKTYKFNLANWQLYKFWNKKIIYLHINY